MRSRLLLALATLMLASCGTPAAAPHALVPRTEAPATASPARQAPLTPSAADYVGTLPSPGACPLVQGHWPNPACTTGAINPDVVESCVQGPCTGQARGDIDQTICTSGWSTRERAQLFPVSVSEGVKRSMVAAEGLTGPLSAYELDHFDAIETGGAVNSLANLWVQPWDGTFGAHAKDTEENTLHTRVCSGAISVTEALQQYRIDWGGPPR